MKTAILLTAGLVAAGASSPNTKATVPQDSANVLTIADRLPLYTEPIYVAPVADAKPQANCADGKCAVRAKEHGPVRQVLSRDCDGPVRRVLHRRERGGRLFGGRCRGCG